MPNHERVVRGDNRRLRKIPRNDSFSTAPIITALEAVDGLDGLKIVSEIGKGRCGGGTVFRSDKAFRPRS